MSKPECDKVIYNKTVLIIKKLAVLLEINKTKIINFQYEKQHS